MASTNKTESFFEEIMFLIIARFFASHIVIIFYDYNFSVLNNSRWFFLLFDLTFLMPAGYLPEEIFREIFCLQRHSVLLPITTDIYNLNASFKPPNICYVDVKLTGSVDVNVSAFHQINAAAHGYTSFKMFLYPPKFVSFFALHYLKCRPSVVIQKCKLSANGRWFNVFDFLIESYTSHDQCSFISR